MINIKEQLEQWIEQGALKQKIYEPKYGGKDHSGYDTLMKYEVNDERVDAYLACANEMKELLLIAVEALEKYEHLNVYDVGPVANQALLKIQEKIKGE